MRELVYDPLRKRDVALTPEEGVRQRMIMWLHSKLGFSLNNMMSEYSFKYNGLLYRADIVVFEIIFSNILEALLIYLTPFYLF